MPVTTPGNYAEKLRDASHFPHVLDHLFRPALIKAGYRVIAPTSRGAQLIHAEIIKNLEQADLVLCDLSSLNANVFFELGIRTALDRPVVLVKDMMTERIPFDLNAINTHAYDESLTPWTLTSEIDRLAEHVKAVDTDAGSGNDMWHYFGLTKRATPAEITGNPTEAKLDLLLTEVTALKARGGQTVSSLSGMSEHASSEAEDIVGAWFREALRARTGKPSPRIGVIKVVDGFRITVEGSLTDNDRLFLEQRAKEVVGEKVIIDLA
jgi:hypothetical protein